MTDLVDFVLAQHGGAERWQGAETISAQVHVHGAFWPYKGQPDLLGSENFDAVVCLVQRSGRQRLVPPTSEDASTGTVTTVNQSPREATEYDLIVPAAGAGGENVADRAVRGGLPAVLVEHELVGGECSYWACVPPKALARGRDVDQQERRQCGRVDSRAGATR